MSKTELPEMEIRHIIYKPRSDADGMTFLPIEVGLLIDGDVDERLKKINDLIEQLEKFRKECWREIDRLKIKKITDPLFAEIRKLKGEE